MNRPPHTSPPDQELAADRLERLNRRAQELAREMRATDPRLQGNPFGPYAQRYKDVIDAGGTPEVVEAFRADLFDRQDLFLGLLAAEPTEDDGEEITRRAGQLLMLDCIDETLRSLQKLFF